MPSLRSVLLCAWSATLAFAAPHNERDHADKRGLVGLLPSASKVPLPTALTNLPLPTGLLNFTQPFSSSGPSSCNMLPQNEYSTTAPQSVSLNPEKLQTALDYAAIMGSSSIKVFRNGCLAGQGFRDALDDRVPSLNAGQTKAVVTLVAGILADNGWIDLDAPIADYIPKDLGNATHRAISTRIFMEETSGVQVNLIEGLNFFLDISRTREYFATPLLHPAGTYFEFDEITPSVVVYVLQQVIQKHLGEHVTFQDFVQCQLFDALGIPESAYFWQEDRSGVTTGYSGLWLRPLEYGRFGLMLLNNGVFGGKRVLSESFVQQIQQGTKANCGFGLYFWLNSCKKGEMQVNTDYPSRQVLPGEAWTESAPSDMYFSLGLGTNTFILPSLNMVVTRDGYQELDNIPGAVNGDLHGAFPGNAGGPGEHEFFRLLMDAVEDMPESVRKTIQNSGPYNRPPDEDVALAPFLLPLSAPLGSYTALGPEGPVGCNAISCKQSANNGDLWIGEIPRVIPGLVGLETRPSGAEPGNCNPEQIKIYPISGLLNGPPASGSVL